MFLIYFNFFPGYEALWNIVASPSCTTLAAWNIAQYIGRFPGYFFHCGLNIV